MRTIFGALVLVLVLAGCGTPDPQDLFGADLSGADLLPGVSLTDAILTGADLTDAILTGAIGLD